MPWHANEGETTCMQQQQVLLGDGSLSHTHSQRKAAGGTHRLADGSSVNHRMAPRPGPHAAEKRWAWRPVGSGRRLERRRAIG